MYRQREALSAAAKQRGWDLVDVVADEGESGGKSHEKRPGLCETIARIEAGEADALAVAKLDRLSRSVRDLADLAERSKPKGKRKGWGLILLDIDVDTSSPSGEFMVNAMGSAAQWERRIISQRTKDALAVRRAQGVRLGRPSTFAASSARDRAGTTGTALRSAPPLAARRRRTDGSWRDLVAGDDQQGVQGQAAALFPPVR